MCSLGDERESGESGKESLKRWESAKSESEKSAESEKTADLAY